MGKFVVDTSALIDNPFLCEKIDGEIIVPYVTIQELDKLKSENYNAREAIRQLEKCDRVLVDRDFEIENNDDMILDTAITNNATLITNDCGLKLKAKTVGVKYESIEDEKDDYKGYKEVTPSDAELAFFYENLDENTYDLNVNQYLNVRFDNKDNLLRWNGESHVNVHRVQVESKLMGKVSAKDIYQKFALDSLLHNQMTTIKGRAGSGKSLLSLAYAMSEIESGKKFSKLVVFVNPINVKNSSRLGFYPGSRTEKLLDTAIGSMLSSKFGSMTEVERRIEQEEIMLLPFGDIRGFDTSGMKAIVYVAESQNLDIDLMKLAIQRVGSDSKLIIDGDYRQQTDSREYEGSKNGMRRVSEVFRGQSFYGEVELPNIYRSNLAQIADLM